MTRHSFRRAALTAVAAGAILFSLVPAADEPKKADDAAVLDGLDEAIRQQAPALVKHLRGKNYANVGVVKFLVRKGDAAPTDNVGELNLGVANRLEVALVLANPDDEMGIIQQASRTVTKENNVRANHLTKEGRRAFFTHEYDLAWGPRTVEASAFVTGLVTISKDLRKTTLKFQVFDKDGNIEDVLDEVALDTSPRVLTESGHSYLLSPQFHKDTFADAAKDKDHRFPRAVLVDKIEAQSVLAVGTTTTDIKEPSPYREGPVKLTIYYGNTPQKIDEKGNVPEPKESDKVKFVLENPTKDTYAVLLKLNGVNTLFAETISDPKVCHKWVLRPGQKQVIDAFQVNDVDTDEFKVLSPKESAENEVNYGAHAGTFRMACFKGAVVKEDPSAESNKTKDEVQLVRAAIARGNLNGSADIKAGSLRALKKTLRGREKSGDGARGMIVQGGPGGKKEVEHLFFKYEQADPVHDVTIRYYVPKGR